MAAGPSGTSINEDEEFEFRARAEKERRVRATSQTPPQQDAQAPEETGAQSTPPIPGMGDVALQAIPKGVANLLNTPNVINHLALKGLSMIPGLDQIPELKDLAERYNRNPIMGLMEKAGIVDHTKDPQTGPQRIVDTAIQSAVGAMAGPAGKIKDVVRAAGVGLTSGAVGQTTKEFTRDMAGETGSTLLAVAAGALTPLAISGTGRKVDSFIGTQTKKALLKEARKEGLVVEPAAVHSGRPTELIESFGGKASVAQLASIKNQPIINDLAARSIGLPKGTEITTSVIDAVRNTASKPYRDLAGVSPQAQTVLEDLKKVRFEANDHWKYYNKTGNPDAGKTARTLNARESQLERQLDTIATQAGRPDLVPSMKASRKIIARSYDIERALIEGPGEVSASAIAAMKKNGRKLSDELDLIARFNQGFGRSSRVASTVPPPSVSGTDAITGMLMGSAGSAAFGPLGATLAAVPLLRKPARELVLGKMFQDHLLKEVPTTPIGRTGMRSAITGSTLFQNNQQSPKD